MKKRFVIAVEDLTTQETQEISDFFKGSYGWWHWIEGFWLISDPRGELTAAEIRDIIGDIAPKKRCMVLQIKQVGGWAGFGPSNPSKDMFKWIRETWSPKE